MRPGLGLTSSASPETAALKDEINRNFDVLNGALVGVMEWARAKGSATGAGVVSFPHSLGSKPDVILVMMDRVGVTWGASSGLQNGWGPSSASISVSGACNFVAFVGRLEGS